MKIINFEQINLVYYSSSFIKNQFQKKNQCLAKDQNSNSNKDGYYFEKCQSGKDKKSKNIIINNPFNTRNPLLK